MKEMVAYSKNGLYTICTKMCIDMKAVISLSFCYRLISLLKKLLKNHNLIFIFNWKTTKFER